VIPSDVAEYRERHRTRNIGPHYNGWLHFAVTTAGSLGAIAFAVTHVRAPSPLELAAIPVFFLIANLAEYFGHRGPMHHYNPRLGIIFERHAQQHHRYYTHDAMAASSHHDFQMVLFPPVMLAFFLGLIATPLGLLFGLLLTPNLGWLFAATGVGYFLTYEWLHWSYHQPDDSWMGRRALVRALRRHHTIHHDLSRMTRVNFNITFPIADAMFGTRARD
jgi:uncharacterized membrane protein